MKKYLSLSAAVVLVCTIGGQAQVFLSGGNYSQNFDTLANTGTANTWTDNSTLAGWYAQSTNASPVTANYRADDGSSNAGDLDSYGTVASTDRALGTLASGTPGTIALGLRIQNDTANIVDSITIGYVGEQWRNGGNTSPQTNLFFSYRISSTAITSADLAGAFTWTPVTALNFVSPTVGATASALNGNLAANQVVLSATLSGLNLNPGDEIFLRWTDINDVGNDHGGGIDNLTLSIPEPSTFGIAALGFSMLGFSMFKKRK